MINIECITRLLERHYGLKPKIKFVLKSGLTYPRGYTNAYTKTIYIYLSRDMTKTYSDIILYLILHESKHLIQLRDKYGGDIKRFLKDYTREIKMISREGITPESTPLEYEAMRFGAEESKKIMEEFMKCIETHGKLPLHPENIIVIRLTPEGKKEILPEYLYYTLQWLWRSGVFKTLARGTARYHITIDDIKRITVGIKSLGELADIFILNGREVQTGDILIQRVSGDISLVGKPFYVK